MRSILILSPLALTILFPLPVGGAGGQDDRREPRTFLPPPGSWTEYRVQSGSATSFEGRNSGRLQANAPAELIQRRILLIRPREGDEAVLFISNPLSRGEPEARDALMFLHFTEAGVEPLDGPVEWDLRTFDFRWHLLGSLTGPPLRAGAGWTAAENRPRWTPFSGMFEYLVERPPSPPGALALKCRRTGPVKRLLPPGRELMDVITCSRDILFDERTGRLLSYLVVEENSPRESEQGRRAVDFRTIRTVEIAELTHRLLESPALESLQREMALLRPAATASPEAAAEALAALEAYHQAFPDGVLRPAAEAFQKALEENSRRLAEDRKRVEERKAAFSGRGPAPELVVRDLEGRTVSLSEFRGKPVLLSFGDLSSPAGRAEVRFLGQWQEKYAERGLVVISVLDQRPQPEEADDLRRAGLRHVCYEERGETESGSIRYGVFRRPVEFYLDRQGQLVLRRQGFLTATAGLREEKIVELLLEGKP